MNDNNMIIFGISRFAELLKYYVEETTNYKVVAFTVNKRYINRDMIDGVKVIPFEELDIHFRTDSVSILLAIGYNSMNNIRKSVYMNVLDKGYKIASYLHPTANIAPNCKIGEGNIILENVILQPYVEVGNCNTLWNQTNISHHSIIGNFNWFGASVVLSGGVTIQDNCFLGSNCVLRNDVNILKFTLVGAGAYVSIDIPEYSVVVPNKSIILPNKKSIEIKID